VEKRAIEKRTKQLVEVEKLADLSSKLLEDNILTLTPIHPTYPLLYLLRHDLNVCRGPRGKN
jgi:hypothetical protein